jgi:dolichol-phosphate mannosyltransferase
MGSSVKVYIVLPCYNEALSLEALLPRIQATMQALPFPYEVVVVNDGSVDATLAVAQRWAALLPVRIVDHGVNKGLGEALKSGLLTTGNECQPEDLIVTMDADNTHPPEIIPTLIEKIKSGADVVIASRYVAGAEEIGLSARRKILSWGASSLLSTFFPVKNVKDYTCGYRAYRATTIKQAIQIYGELFVQERGFTSIVDILLKLRKLGISASEIPLVLHYDFKAGESKMPVMKTILRYWTVISRNLSAPGARPFRYVALN